MKIDGMVEGVVLLSVMAMDAACQPDPLQTGRRIVELAAKLIPCAAVDIVQYGAHRALRVTASSDPAISAHLVTALEQWPHDPYPDVHSDRAPVVANHPAGYVRQVRDRAAVAAELTFPLRVDQADHGFLRFLIQDSMALYSEGCELGAAFAAHAAIALDRAALQATVGNLHKAVDSNREIGAAIGILMARGGISYDAGFQLLKTTSQYNNRKLRDVVAAVLYTGELPSYRLPAPGDSPG